jgi:signal transduction histidine kinase
MDVAAIRLKDATPTEASELALAPVDDARTRLAYALHDGLTQVVTASVLELEALARRVELDPTAASEALAEAAAHLRDALDEIRALLSGLDPATGPGERGLERLMTELLERWQLPVRWWVDGDLGRVPAPVLETASAVIREGVTNAAKHGSPGEITARVHATSGHVDVVVHDDGLGFDAPGTGHRAGHLGIAMIRRRVKEAGGTLHITSEPGRGTTLRAELPIPDREVQP